MPNPRTVRVNNADELQVQLDAYAIWKAQEATLVDGPKPEGSIRFDDADGISREITFDMGVIDRETASRLITGTGGMVYLGAQQSSQDGVTQYVYGR